MQSFFSGIYYFPMVSLLVQLFACTAICIIMYASFKKILKRAEIDETAAKFIKGAICILYLIIMIVVISNGLKSVSVNLAPKSTIDRSDLNKQTDRYEKAVKETK